MSSDGDTQAHKRRRLDNIHSTDNTLYLYAASSYNTTLNVTRQEYDSPPVADTPPNCSFEPGPSGWQNICDDEEGNEEVERCTSKECCYGMLASIPVRSSRATGPNPNPNPIHLPVLFKPPNGVISSIQTGSIFFEILCSPTSTILSEFVEAADVSIQLYCYPNLAPKAVSKKKGEQTYRSWFLNAILYGPLGLHKTVGDHLSKQRLYLQDPNGCDRDVLYQNPHIVSSETNEVIMTSFFGSDPFKVEIEHLEASPDLLVKLMEDVEQLPVTQAPWGVVTNLFRHQKQALTFMLRREQGWALDQPDRDIWTRQKDAVGRFSYVNNVSGVTHYTTPPCFRGGLLADDMGLGKTLSMICLIASDKSSLTLPSLPIHPRSLDVNPWLTTRTTLLIVPLSLITTWVKQLSMHLQQDLLKVYVYHGQKRRDTEALCHYDIIITTYHTVSREWRIRESALCKSSTSIFSVVWHRIILDEAHIIQNRQSDLAKACCALKSSRRWAITGTPIQNKLTDFASIVQFLQVYPYSEQSLFEEDILKPWQKHDPQGFLRLKTLVRKITIGRTKAVIELPCRTDEVHRLEFSPEEREQYERAKIQTRTLLEDAISNASQSGKAFNALQRLNVLRLICSHGLFTRHCQGAERYQSSSDSSVISDDMRIDSCEEVLLTNETACSQCGKDIVEEFSNDASIDDYGTISYGAQTLCEVCIHGTQRLESIQFNSLLSLQSSGSSGSISPSPSTSIADDLEMADIESMPTKVKALTADLLQHYLSEKSVVFSFWTYTLDLVELMLKRHRILYTRIDGKMNWQKRAISQENFQKSDSLRVILVSITCGGAGLDLTAASRAYLLEPHWNPMIEEQALCRVHRVGQQREVTTVRYVMRDSFEEQVVNIQKRKKLLAEVTFTQKALTKEGVDMGTLEYLKAALD